jgi:hypothetical protein
MAIDAYFQLTISQISASERLVAGTLLVVAGIFLLRFMPTILEKQFGRENPSKVQSIGGPVFVLSIGVILFIGGLVQLA